MLINQIKKVRQFLIEVMTLRMEDEINSGGLDAFITSFLDGNVENYIIGSTVEVTWKWHFVPNDIILVNTLLGRKPTKGLLEIVRKLNKETNNQ